MPREKKSVATQIAYKILGVPSNIAYKPDEKQKKIKERLTFEDAARLR